MTDAPEPRPADEILRDLLSQDPRRITRAANDAIKAPQAVLLELAPHADRIDRATDDLDYGGALHSNANHVEQAIRVIRAAGAGECECTTWHGWLFYEPAKLEKAGKVEILGTSEPGWSMTYDCRCTACGRRCTVDQNDTHFTYWRWSRPKKGD